MLKDTRNCQDPENGWLCSSERICACQLKAAPASMTYVCGHCMSSRTPEIYVLDSQDGLVLKYGCLFPLPNFYLTTKTQIPVC